MRLPVSPPEAADLGTDLDRLRVQLLVHPLYETIQSVESLRIFMREHAFAVWDFMSLLKRLQRLVTCCEVPWLPAADATVVRFINEIVLGEECDEDGRGGYSSHFEFYLESMDEIGADARPIREFVARLRQGTTLDQALQQAPILESTREFVRATLHVAMQGKPHEIAASFYYGREDVIPDMFTRLVESMPRQGIAVERLVHYLQRHIELDANDHGPLAQKLVSSLCDNQREREQESALAAISAIEQRMSLWDGILGEIQRQGQA